MPLSCESIRSHELQEATTDPSTRRVKVSRTDVEVVEPADDGDVLEPTDNEAVPASTEPPRAGTSALGPPLHATGAPVFAFIIVVVPSMVRGGGPPCAIDPHPTKGDARPSTDTTIIVLRTGSLGGNARHPNVFHRIDDCMLLLTILLRHNVRPKWSRRCCIEIALPIRDLQ
jgi:hypothetical protein